MKEIIQTITKLNEAYKPLMITNLYTEVPLVFLDPQFRTENGRIWIQFESLNERGGNSVNCVAILEKIDDTIYFENELDVIFQLIPINLNRYRRYIQTHYMGAPNFGSEEKMKNFILAQLKNA